jgi:hypothetical protein
MQKTAKILTKSALGFGLVLLLSGCLGNNPEPIQISAKPLDKPQLNLPPVDELRLRTVDWIVINRENLEEKIAELETAGVPIGLYVLTGEGYENLGLNISDIRALIQQQQEIIVAYENYYKASEAAIDEYNQSLND